MTGLEGTVHTPVGTVQKKTAVMLGVGAVFVVGVVWYRQKKLADSVPATITDGEINPATGYPYGSAEDAAALDSQNNYMSPTGNSGGGGSSGIPTSNVGYTSNGQWSQAVIQTLTNNGAISDPSTLSAALGKYLTGAYVDPSDATTNSLIQQAIAVEGYPPVAGSNGYPPSINRNPPVSSTPTPPTTTHPGGPVVTNLRAVHSDRTSIVYTWNWAVKPDYCELYKNNLPFTILKGAPTTYTMTGLKPNTTYRFQVRGTVGNTVGPTATIDTGKTKP